MLLELENEFGAEVSTGAIKFTGEINDHLKEAVIKHPNHHVFVDEYILRLDRKEKIIEMMGELKLFTKVKKYFYQILWTP